MHMHYTTWNSATNASLNPETELGVLEIHMVGCTEPIEQQKTMS